MYLCQWDLKRNQAVKEIRQDQQAYNISVLVFFIKNDIIIEIGKPFPMFET